MTTYHSSGVQPTTTVAPRMGETLRAEMFLCLMLGPIMIMNEHDMLTKFLRMKPHTFIGFEIEDAFEFIVD